MYKVVRRLDLNPLRNFLCQERHLTRWVMNLVDKWVAGGVKMRVFTDKWPDCSCAVFFYQEWFPQDSNTLKPGDDHEVSFVVGNQSHTTRILEHPGVIDWTKKNWVVTAFKQSVADDLIKSVHHPLGREYGCFFPGDLVKYASYIDLIPHRRKLPDGFIIKPLQPSNAEFIAQYFLKEMPSVWIARFMHCISVGSMGAFTRTTPTKLVSWMVRDMVNGAMHHIYTLEEYRGKGLAAAVSNELSKSIIDEGQLPFGYIAIGNDPVFALHERVAHVKVENEVLQFVRTSPVYNFYNNKI